LIAPPQGRRAGEASFGLNLAAVRRIRKSGAISKNQRVSGFAVIEQVFESAFARKRIAANYLCIILVPFVKELLMHGYARATIRLHVEVIEHFGQWLSRSNSIAKGVTVWK
jgi:hypothetical protein